MLAEDYVKYHVSMMHAKDTDPAYDCLLYVCERFELNVEQRLWIAFLYAATYCPTTTYYIYNEFPDYETVDLNRMRRWWSKNRENLIFQTDRRWVRSRNQFVDMVASYQKKIGGLSQYQKFKSCKHKKPEVTYNNLWKEFSSLYQMGRFGMFLYLEAVNRLVGIEMVPTNLDLVDASSCRNGLCYALDKPELSDHFKKKKLNRADMTWLYENFFKIYKIIEGIRPSDTTIWSVETTLCAYKKYRLGKRYVGYYIERMRKEIVQMERNIPEGVDWSVLWDFRREFYDHKYLKEFTDEDSDIGR